MRAQGYVAPTTLPHDPPASRCARACCWTPLGHSAIAPETCTCHKENPMADHTPKAALKLLDARDTRVCVLTGYQGPRIVPQHRQTGAGGRKDKHRTANMLWIDSIPNGIIVADADAQLIAKVYGVAVPFWADVETVPVRFSDACWYRLQGDAKTAITVGEAHELMHATYGPEWFDWLARVEGSPIALARLRAWS